MRYLLGAVLVAAAGLFAVVAPAHADAEPGTALGPDGYSVLAGVAEAPVQLEIFCEPQCPHCAQFAVASGEQLAQRLGNGELAVTYRWLTFLDDKRHSDTSARVANALLLAAEPGTTATAYQRFVNELYRQQDSPAAAPTAIDLAGTAARNGVSGLAVARIAIDSPAVDTTAMSTANMARLKQVNPADPGTPTVYDLNTNRPVSTDDPGWLDGLFAH